MGTLLDLASLVMIPSGVKEDKLYSVKPTDGSGEYHRESRRTNYTASSQLMAQAILHLVEIATSKRHG